MRTHILGLFFISGVLMTNCSKNTTATPETDTITKSDILIERKIENSINDVNNILNAEVRFGAAKTSSKSSDTPNPWLPTCATITSTQNGNTWTRTIDFGTEGCILPNGSILKGKIIMSFTNDSQSTTRIISHTFENFSYNNNKINGNSTLTTTKANTAGNPESKLEFDWLITRENGDTCTRKGLRVREWITGYETPNDKNDDVYILTGNWSTSSPSKTLSATITKPLKQLGSCHYIVEGTIEFKRNTEIAILDFGNGECDKFATLSINGGPVETIELDRD